MPRVWHFPDPSPIFGQGKPELKNCFRRWPLPIIPPKAALSFIKLPVWVIKGRFRMCYCFRYGARSVFRIPVQELLGQGTCLMLLNLGEISRSVHFVAGVDCWIALFLRRNLRVVKRFTPFKITRSKIETYYQAKILFEIYISWRNLLGIYITWCDLPEIYAFCNTATQHHVLLPWLLRFIFGFSICYFGQKQNYKSPWNVTLNHSSSLKHLQKI